jgi:hypothetical protein
MPLTQLRNVNFGRNRANATGSTGVGFTVLDYAGAIVSPRTTAGVYQLTSGSGLYAAYVTFQDSFHGQLMWDTGVAFTTASYATEQYNVEENDPKVADTWSMVNSITGSIQMIYDVSTGRWKMTGNQLILYKEDNVTIVHKFNLFDDLGNPTMDAVFERVKV